MKTLHVVSMNNPGILDSLPSGEQDVLLTEDAVCMLAVNVPRITELAGQQSLFALEPDLVARGISCPEGVTAVDYAGMVKLTETHAPIVCWN